MSARIHPMHAVGRLGIEPSSRRVKAGSISLMLTPHVFLLLLRGVWWNRTTRHWPLFYRQLGHHVLVRPRMRDAQKSPRPESNRITPLTMRVLDHREAWARTHACEACGELARRERGVLRKVGMARRGRGAAAPRAVQTIMFDMRAIDVDMRLRIAIDDA